MFEVSKLSELSDVISNEIENVTWGGCCVFASLAGQKIQQFCDVKVIVYSNKDITGVDIENVRPLIDPTDVDEWNSNGVYFGHVVLEIDDGYNIYHYDSCDVYPADNSICPGLDRIPGYLTVEEATILASTPNGWNICFNRDNIPKMEEIVNDFFEYLEVA